MAKKKRKSKVKIIDNIPSPLVIIPLIVFVMIIFSLMFFRTLYPELRFVDGQALDLSDSQEFSVDDNQELVLPEIFPNEFPLPKGGKIDSVNSDKSSEVEAASVIVKTKQDFESVIDFYEIELHKGDWVNTSQFTKNNSKVFTVSSEEFDGFVAIAGGDQETVISITLSRPLF